MPPRWRQVNRTILAKFGNLLVFFFNPLSPNDEVRINTVANRISSNVLRNFRLRAVPWNVDWVAYHAILWWWLSRGVCTLIGCPCAQKAIRSVTFSEILFFHTQLKVKINPSSITCWEINIFKNKKIPDMNLRWKAQICNIIVKLQIGKKLGSFKVGLFIRYRE